MTMYQIKYCRIPTNFHDAANALVEAETPEAAKTLLRQQLGEGNGVHNYVIDTPREYTPEPVKGRIVSLG